MLAKPRAGRSLVLTKFAPRKFTKKRTYEVMVDSNRYDSAFDVAPKSAPGTSKKQKTENQQPNNGKPQHKSPHDPS